MLCFLSDAADNAGAGGKISPLAANVHLASGEYRHVLLSLWLAGGTQGVIQP